MLSKIAINNPIFSWMVMIAFIVFGAMSFQRLGISRLPDVDAPIVNIDLKMEGAAAAVMESDIVDVVENSIITVNGIKEIRSVSTDGKADITVELLLEKNVDVALQEIQAKIERARRYLPPELEPAVLTKTNPDSSPIIYIAVTSDKPLKDQMLFVRNHLLQKFQSIPGVGDISMGGYVERNIRVWADANKLRQFELTADDIINTITVQHAEIPAGIIENKDTRYSLRSMGESVHISDLENLYINQRGGRPVTNLIRLKDVAVVKDGLEEVKRISRFDGKQSVGLGIRKQTGSNAVQVGRAVKKRLQEVQATLPAGFKAEIASDYTIFIEESIHELLFTIFLSAMLTGIITWVFFGNPSSTINVLLAIPTSIIGTFMALDYFGFTMNTFTLLALTLATGVLVDDAIMVLENIVRHNEEGEDLKTAALNGAKEITFAALASTLAITAIFLPVAFMQGPSGRYFLEFGLTISVAIMISLLEALTLTPMRCSTYLKVGSGSGKPYFMEKIFAKMETKYLKVLHIVIANPWKILGFAAILFASSALILIPLKREFIPPQDQSRLFLNVTAPIGYSIFKTDEFTRKVEAVLKEQPQIQHYFTAVGGFGGGQSNKANMFIRLYPPEMRPKDPATGRNDHLFIQGLLRKKLNKISKDFRVSVIDPSTRGFSDQRGYPVEVSIRGPDWDQLGELSQKIVGAYDESPLIVDADSDFEPGQPEIKVYPDRKKAAQYGVSIDNIGRTVNALIAGRPVGKFEEDGRNYDIRVRLREDQIKDPNSVNRLLLRNNYGEIVSMDKLVQIKIGKTLQAITRLDRERAVTIHANNCTECSQDDSLKEALKIAHKILPEGYSVITSGISRESEDSRKDLIFALLFGIAIAYMILASQFNSLIHPLTVLLAMPFSFSGAILALYVTGNSLNMYSFIGLILLMGLVKKNSILLVDFTNQRRKEGMDIDSALLEACPLRLRPIVMTSVSSIAAAIPPALSIGAGSESHRGMAVVVIGGMFVSTLLTLIVVPAFYRVMSKLERYQYK